MNNNKEDNYGLNEHFQYYSPKTNEDDTIDPKSFKIIETISKHKDSIFSLNLLNDNRIASISIDSTIRIFNPSNNYKCEKVIKHDRVSSLCQLNDGTIVTCSHNKSITIGDHTINDAHTAPINSVILLPNDRIATCSDDKTIKIWSTAYPYIDNPIKVLKGFRTEVKCILYIKERDMLVVGDLDRTIQLWNMSTYKCISVINRSDKGWIDKMYLIDKDRVVFGHDDIFTIINVGKCIVEEEVEDAMMGYVTCFTKLNDKYIICGCCGGLCLYNMEDRTYKIIEYGHCMPPCDIIKIDEHTFATCEENIKIWTYE